MDFTIAFALGLIGSLHCAAMCGPLQLALPIPAGGAGRIIAGRLLYQGGRITTYCLLGAVAGWLGHAIAFAGMQRALSIGLGVAILGGLLVSKKVALSVPAVKLVMALKSAMSAQLRQRGFRSLTLLGLLNGLLPCGLVYVAMAGAVAAGSLVRGMACMAVFGLGTLPMMLAISLSGKIFPPQLRLRLRAMIPAGICVVAALLILRGMALGIPYLSPDLTSGAANCCAN